MQCVRRSAQPFFWLFAALVAFAGVAIPSLPMRAASSIDWCSKAFDESVLWDAQDALVGDVVFNEACRYLYKCYRHGWQYGMDQGLCNERFYNKMNSACEGDPWEGGNGPIASTLAVAGWVGKIPILVKGVSLKAMAKVADIPTNQAELVNEVANKLGNKFVAASECYAWSSIYVIRSDDEEREERFHRNPWTNSGTIDNPSTDTSTTLECAPKVKTYAGDLWTRDNFNIFGNEPYCYPGFVIEYWNNTEWVRIRKASDPWNGYVTHAGNPVWIDALTWFRYRPSRRPDGDACAAAKIHPNAGFEIVYSGNGFWADGSEKIGPKFFHSDHMGYPCFNENRWKEWEVFGVLFKDFRNKDAPTSSSMFTIEVPHPTGDYRKYGTSVPRTGAFVAHEGPTEEALPEEVANSSTPGPWQRAWVMYLSDNDTYLTDDVYYCDCDKTSCEYQYSLDLTSDTRADYLAENEPDVCPYFHNYSVLPQAKACTDGNGDDTFNCEYSGGNYMCWAEVPSNTCR